MKSMKHGVYYEDTKYVFWCVLRRPAAPHRQLLRGACLHGLFDGKEGCLKLIINDYGYLKYDIWVFVRL